MKYSDDTVSELKGCVRFHRMSSKLIVFTLLIFSTLNPFQPLTASSATLKIFWSKPIPGDALTPSGVFILSDISNQSTGSIMLLARESSSKVLLIEPDEKGLGSVVPVKSKALVAGIARGPANTLWLGGLINQRMYFPGLDLADAYLGRLDPREGRIIAEYTFSKFGKYRGIWGLQSLPSGELVVAGRESRENWLAAVSIQGSILWERKFGVGKGVALATGGDRIMIVALEDATVNDKNRYQEDVAMRIYDSAGVLLGRQIIRAGINERRSGSYGRLAIKRSGDAMYVLSSWGEEFRAKPIEVTKLSVNGRPLWRKELTQSISQEKNKAWTSCDQNQAVLADGDLLVACSIKKQIRIFRLNSKDGNLKVVSVPLPTCHEGRPAALFLTQRPNGAIWIFGSRPGNNVAASCTWLGALSLR